jgi:hypothetical protein
MPDVFGLIFPLFGLIGLGFLAGRLSAQPLEALGWLTSFVIYFALPALFFKLLAVTPVEKLGSWSFIATNIAITFAVFVTTLLIGLAATRGRLAEATVQGLAGAYGNIGYMGPSIAILALGEQAAVPVALIFCFENLMHFVNAPGLMALAGQTKGSIARIAGGVLRKIVFHPFILATMAGVAAAYLELSPPQPIERLIAYLAQAAAPCALFAMGVTMALRPLKRVPVALAYIVPMKLIVHPVAMFLGLSAIGGLDPIWVETAVLLAALPTATNVFVIAQQYGIWVERASAAILVTTLASVATVAALIYAIKQGVLVAG